MKNLFVLFLVAGLALAGCARKPAIEDHLVSEATAPAAPVVSEPAEPVDVAPAKPEPKVEMAAAKIFFDFDSYVLSSANKALLQGNAAWLKAHPELRIVIEGHTDERGSSSYNLALGEKRAEAARAYLQNLGIAPERIKVVSYGKEKAVQGAGNEAVWARDRRAEFVIAN